MDIRATASVLKSYRPAPEITNRIAEIWQRLPQMLK